MTDYGPYGSGTLAPWQGLQHGVYNPDGVATFDQADLLQIGDSITNLGKEELASTLSANFGAKVVVDYWSGRPTTPAVDRLLSLTYVPKRVIMATGTNDLFDPSVMAAQILRVKEWLAARPEVEHFWWIDTYASRVMYAAPDLRNTGWVNSQIRDAFPAEQIIPWSVWLASKPSRIGMYISPDGVHPISGAGTNFWADVIKQAVAPTF